VIIYKDNKSAFHFRLHISSIGKKLQSKQISCRLLMTARIQLSFGTMAFSIWCKTQALKTCYAVSRLCRICEVYNGVRDQCYISELLHTHISPCIVPIVHSWPMSQMLLTACQKDVIYRISETTQVRKWKPSK